MLAPRRLTLLVAVSMLACRTRIERGGPDARATVVVAVPPPPSATTPTPSRPRMTIAVLDRTSLLVDGVPMPRAGLRAAAAARAGTPGLYAEITAGPSIPYSVVIEVMDDLRAVGVTDVVFGVEKP